MAKIRKSDNSGYSVQPGRSHPLGATINRDCVNFSVYSKICCVKALGRQLEFMDAATGNENSPLPRLRRAMRAYIDFGFSEPDRYKIIHMADNSQYVGTASILDEGGAADEASRFPLG